MRRRALALAGLFLFSACAPGAPLASKSSLYVFRLNPAGLVELDSGYLPRREIPLTIPDGCGLDSMHAPPQGTKLAIELSCPFGQSVILADTTSGVFQQPVTDSDSHFLAWSADGQGLYLKVNSINHPHIVRIGMDGVRTDLAISELTYDLAAATNGSGDIVYAFSGGMGLGSELWLDPGDGGVPRQLASDASNYISLARWSPDGREIAFIKIPDTATPYTVGELWVMGADGSGAHALAQADAGHGFAPAWSPDGNAIAFVYRENPGDARADQAEAALVSNLHAVMVWDAKERPLTALEDALVEEPSWQPDGNHLAFTVTLDDKMRVDVLDVQTATLQQVAIDAVCCAAWVRK